MLTPKLNMTETSLRNYAQRWPRKPVYVQIKQQYYKSYTTTATATTTTVAAAAADIRKMSHMSKDYKRRQTASLFKSYVKITQTY